MMEDTADALHPLAQFVIQYGSFTMIVGGYVDKYGVEWMYSNTLRVIEDFCLVVYPVSFTAFMLTPLGVLWWRGELLDRLLHY